MRKLVGLLAFFLLIPTASSMSFGSIPSTTSLELYKGEQGIFKVYFFNLGERKIYVNLEAEYPKELKVEIWPKRLELKSEITSFPHECEDCGWLALSDGRYVRITPVYVSVRIPKKISTNLYKIKLIAVATSPKEGGEGIRQSLAQVREITLKAYVHGQVSEILEEYNFTNYTFEERNFSLPITGKATIPEVEEKEEGEKTGISLPTGFLTLTEEQKRAFDVGIVITALLGIILIVRILR